MNFYATFNPILNIEMQNTNNWKSMLIWFFKNSLLARHIMPFCQVARHVLVQFSSLNKNYFAIPINPRRPYQFLWNLGYAMP